MFTGTLRPFQVPAVKKSLSMGEQLLVLDMGLGKTPTTLAIIEDLLECGDVVSGLWVTLSTLKYQTLDSIREFTNSDGLVIEGSKAQRARLYDQARLGKWPYIILNYEQPRDDWDEVRSLPRDFVVCDEVTALGNFKSKRGRKTKRLDAPFKFGLTGTPVENRLDELFSIMEWIDPDVLGRWDLFDKTFIVRANNGMPVRYRNLPLLRRLMEPYWTRVTHDEVSDQLPKVLPGRLVASLDPAGCRLYDVFADDLLNTLEEAQGELGKGFDLWGHYHGESEKASRLKGEIMARLTATRMLTAHPHLLRVSADKYVDTEGKKGSAYLAGLAENGFLDKIPKTTPKLDVLMTKLREAAASGYKTVVFTQWVEMIHLMSAAVEKDRQLPEAVVYHGGLSQKAREAEKQRFKNEDDVGIMISSDAGGYGVDLPEGRMLINYDQPWGSGRLKQRNARIIRLSTEHASVHVIDVVVRGSIDEWIEEKVGIKQTVGSAVVDGKGIDREGRVQATGDSLTNYLASASVWPEGKIKSRT